MVSFDQTEPQPKTVGETGAWHLTPLLWRWALPERTLAEQDWRASRQLFLPRNNCLHHLPYRDETQRQSEAQHFPVEARCPAPSLIVPPHSKRASLASTHRWECGLEPAGSGLLLSSLMHGVGLEILLENNSLSPAEKTLYRQEACPG